MTLSVWPFQLFYSHAEKGVVTYKSSSKVNMPINSDNFIKGSYLSEFRSDNNAVTFSHNR